MCKVYIDRTEEVQHTVYILECVIHTNYKENKPNKTINGELCGECIDKVTVFLTRKKYYEK